MDKQSHWGWEIVEFQYERYLKFSKMPTIGSFIFSQKLISFRIVSKDTSWGEVTMIPPSGLAFFNAFTTVKCSSDVPGGVSITKNQGRRSKRRLNLDNQVVPKMYLSKISWSSGFFWWLELILDNKLPPKLTWVLSKQQEHLQVRPWNKMWDRAIVWLQEGYAH